MAAINLLNNGNICIEVPLKVKFNAGRKVIIASEDIGGNNPGAESGIQNTMVTLLARAHAWMKLFELGKFRNVVEFANYHKIDVSYAGRVLRLANLAPDLQKAIVNGTEPDKLSMQKLRRHIPEDWMEQRIEFGA